MILKVYISHTHSHKYTHIVVFVFINLYCMMQEKQSCLSSNENLLLLSLSFRNILVLKYCILHVSRICIWHFPFGENFPEFSTFVKFC